MSLESVMDRHFLKDEAATRDFGTSLASDLRRGDVLALTGDLGAGKTHLAQGIAAGLGYAGAVTSPTFTLVHEYRGGRLPIFHFDFYRFDSATEAEQIGWWNYVDEDGVCLVEWADKFPELIPPGSRWIELTRPAEGGRMLSMETVEDLPE